MSLDPIIQIVAFRKQWRDVLAKAEDGDHVSDAELRELMEASGVIPPEAEEYVSKRLADEIHLGFGGKARSPYDRWMRAVQMTARFRLFVASFEAQGIRAPIGKARRILAAETKPTRERGGVEGQLSEDRVKQILRDDLKDAPEPVRLHAISADFAAYFLAALVEANHVTLDPESGYVEAHANQVVEQALQLHMDHIGKQVAHNLRGN